MTVDDSVHVVIAGTQSQSFWRYVYVVRGTTTITFFSFIPPSVIVVNEYAITKDIYGHIVRSGSNVVSGRIWCTICVKPGPALDVILTLERY
jgi:hypothetical protein